MSNKKSNEKEDGFFKDLKKTIVEKIAPPDAEYCHNDIENRDPKTLCSASGKECLNGHSHVSQMLIGSSSETVPVQDGEMLLGRWQRIFALELDHEKDREIIMSFIGE